ncbi:MAG: hypothetical protein MK142_10560, partial [Pseudomonadales bacterium]|nr:hypothetical protein [Pseudomonadales bacterium]
KTCFLEAFGDDGAAESSIVDDQQRQSGIHMQRPAVRKLGSVYGALVSGSRTCVTNLQLRDRPFARSDVLSA